MTDQSFHTFMTSIDDDLLEEAKYPLPKRKKHLYWIPVAAACFLFVFLPFYQNSKKIDVTDLVALGYEILLPANASDISYHLLKEAQSEIAQAVFQLNGNSYTYEILKDSEPVMVADASSTISWSSKGLQFSMTESDSQTTVNWYSADDSTTHTLYGNVNSDQILSTAREVLLLTGLDLADAPAGAKDISYRVFTYDNLTVAETTFLYNNVPCSYRMAATLELEESFTDISGMEQEFETSSSGSVDYCRAKINVNPENEGKIIWFDIVPGIIYSLSMDDNASTEGLLNLANDLFKPIQGDSE